MSTVENDRWTLHQKVRECLGEREGDILMEHLPPAGWSHLATKDDVALSGALLRTELAEVRTELKTEIADLRTEIAELRTELKTEIADLRTELKTDIANVVSAMEKGFRSQTWKMVAAIGVSQGVAVSAMALLVQHVK